VGGGDFENSVRWSILGPNRDEVTEGSRKLLNEGFHNLYSSPSIIRVKSSRRMQWEGQVARIGEKKECIHDFGEKARRIRDH
jgi:hypothetical protein